MSSNAGSALSLRIILSTAEYGILYKRYLCFVLGGACIFPQEADVCDVGKEQFHEFWCLHSSDVRLCIVHTMVGDKHCSKTGHSSGSLQYHKPSSAA